MISPRQDFQMPRRSIVYLLMTLAGVLLFVGAGIWPNHRKSVQLDQQQTQLEIQLHEKQQLQPLHAQLEAMLARHRPPELPFPDETPYPRHQVERLSDELSALAARYTFSTLEAAPDVQTLTHDTGYLRMRLALQGEFSQLRPFLIDLNRQGYLYHLEKAEIRQDTGAMLFNLGLWIRTSR